MAGGGIQVDHNQGDKDKRVCPILLIVLLAISLITSAMLSTPAVGQEFSLGGGTRYSPPFDDKRGILSYGPYLKKATKSVVQIRTYELKKGKDSKVRLEPKGTGTGVVFDQQEGLILTNHHVVAAGNVWSVQNTGGEEIEANIVGYDRETDLAVLSAEVKSIPEVKFGDSAVLQVGDLVFAIGYPFGLDKTVSAGIVSGLKRSGFSDLYKKPKFENFIQTDAAINSGNSGGPLIDSLGRVVGINTFILTKSGDSSGLGFAVPSRVVVAVAKQLREYGEIRRGFLGVAFDDLDEATGKALGTDVVSGALITEVRPNSPASRAGLMVGDIVTGAGTDRIESALDFLNFIRVTRAGEPQTLYVRRQDKVLRFEVVLEPFSKAGTAQARSQSAQATSKLRNRLYGATFVEMPVVLNQPSAKKGAKVAHIENGSVAARRGLKVGDVVTHVNNKDVTSATNLMSIAKSGAGGPLVLRVRRAAAEVLVILSD